jgi:hypothetical protein
MAEADPRTWDGDAEVRIPHRRVTSTHPLRPSHPTEVKQPRKKGYVNSISVLSALSPDPRLEPMGVEPELGSQWRAW